MAKSAWQQHHGAAAAARAINSGALPHKAGRQWHGETSRCSGGSALACAGMARSVSGISERMKASKPQSISRISVKRPHQGVAAAKSRKGEISEKWRQHGIIIISMASARKA